MTTAIRQTGISATTIQAAVELIAQRASHREEVPQTDLPSVPRIDLRDAFEAGQIPDCFPDFEPRPGYPRIDLSEAGVGQATDCFPDLDLDLDLPAAVRIDLEEWRASPADELLAEPREELEARIRLRDWSERFEDMKQDGDEKQPLEIDLRRFASIRG